MCLTHSSCDCCRDHTAAEASDEGRTIRPPSAKKRQRAAIEQNSSQSESDAEAVEAQEVAEAMADAYAQRAPPEQDEAAGDSTAPADDDVVGVSGMEAIEAEFGQMFRCLATAVHSSCCILLLSSDNLARLGPDLLKQKQQQHL